MVTARQSEWAAAASALLAGIWSHFLGTSCAYQLFGAGSVGSAGPGGTQVSRAAAVVAGDPLSGGLDGVDVDGGPGTTVAVASDSGSSDCLPVGLAAVPG